MDENLVGYLLKSLEPDEQKAVGEYLEANPEARAKQELLDRALAPLAADVDETDPPAGLALATLARIAEHKCRPLPAAPRPPRNQLAPTGWARVRRADVMAAAVLLLMVGGLALPILIRTYQERDRAACANNLRTVWGALVDYSDRNESGAFPMVETRGPKSVAGAFVPMLHDAGSLNNAVLVSCPARPHIEEPADVSMAALEAAYASSEDDFTRLARNLAGGYAYSLGYAAEGQPIVGLTAKDPGTLPILADLPSGNGNSVNHGGSGQNVLYIGGNVRWCVLRTVGENGDDIYVNRHNYLLAGEGRSDSVLGPGDARPAH